MSLPAPSPTPPRLARGQAKFLICQAIHELTLGKPPQAWHQWDATKTSEFIQAVQGCHTGRSFHQLVLCASQVARAYGRELAQIVPAEALE